MPSFVSRTGGHDATYEGPYKATGVSIRAFFLDGKFLTLASTLKRYLTAVSGDVFLPISDRVIGCFAAMERVEGIDPKLGAMREIDVALFIPAIRFDGLIPKQLVFFAPYLFVDIPQAAFTGREVHGYRKDLGTSFSDKDIYDLGWSADGADLTHVEAWAVPSPHAMLKRMRLLEVVAPAATRTLSPWSGKGGQSGDILEALHGAATDWDSPILKSLQKHVGAKAKSLGSALGSSIDSLFDALWSSAVITVPIVFLRQFRNPRKSKEADICEVLTANVRVPVSSVSADKVSGGYGVRFTDAASHPFSTELGVSATAVTTSMLTMDIHCDFTLEHAQ
jgi:hypothetical protein